MGSSLFFLVFRVFLDIYLRLGKKERRRKKRKEERRELINLFIL